MLQIGTVRQSIEHLTRATFFFELNGKQNKGNAHILQQKTLYYKMKYINILKSQIYTHYKKLHQYSHKTNNI